MRKIFNRRHSEIIFLFFSKQTGFDITCKLSPMETVCMKCQILFSRKNKNKKTIIKVSSAELAHRVVEVRIILHFIPYMPSKTRKHHKSSRDACNEPSF